MSITWGHQSSKLPTTLELCRRLAVEEARVSGNDHSSGRWGAVGARVTAATLDNSSPAADQSSEHASHLPWCPTLVSPFTYKEELPILTLVEAELDIWNGKKVLVQSMRMGDGYVTDRELPLSPLNERTNAFLVAHHPYWSGGPFSRSFNSNNGCTCT